MEFRSSFTATGVDGIDFQKLLREEKNKARRCKTDNKSETVMEVRPIVTKPSYPAWTYPLPMLTVDTQTTVPRLCRSRDRLSPLGIFYIENYLQEHRSYQKELWEWLIQLPTNPFSGHEIRSSPQPHHAVWNFLPHAQRHVALFDCSTPENSSTLTFPSPLQWLVDVLVASNVFPAGTIPNHILVNRYTATQGILPHTDGPAYLDRTATISLGSGSVLFNFNPISSDIPHHHQPQVLLHGNGSLVVFEGLAYSAYMHSIAELSGSEIEHAQDMCLNAETGTAVVRDDRISITIRYHNNKSTSLL